MTYHFYRICKTRKWVKILYAILIVNLRYQKGESVQDVSRLLSKISGNPKLMYFKTKPSYNTKEIKNWTLETNFV